MLRLDIQRIEIDHFENFYKKGYTMKRTILAIGLLSTILLATDFSQMTTQELIDLRGTVAVDERDAYRTEMQSRIPNMTAEELAAFQASRKAGAGMGIGKKGNRANMPTFEEYDADGDGKITQAELEQARADRMAANAEDGKLLKNAANAPSFESMDTNGDGVIDATEFQTHQSTQIENRVPMGGMGQGMGSGMGGHGQGQGGQGQGPGRP